MANKKISDLTAGSALTGTELIEIEQSSTSKYTTPADLKTYMDGFYWVTSKYAKAHRSVSSGTVGGTPTTGAWTKYAGWSEVSDIDSLLAITSDVFVLAAGTYDVFGQAIFAATNPCKLRLRNTTAAATLLNSINGGITTSVGGGGVPATLHGRITVAAAQNLEIQYWASSNGAGTSGLGYAASSGEDEIYAQIEFRKVA